MNPACVVAGLDDVIETQAVLLAQRQQIHRNIDKELKTIQRLKDSPYFERIDFMNTQKIYIGISSMMDQGEENFLIFDWRAPISSLYYDYPSDEAQYETIESSITREIAFKRQFIIRRMFIQGVTIGDQILQEALNKCLSPLNCPRLQALDSK